MAFERLLGPCMDIMKRNTEEYEEQLVRVFGSKVAMSNDSHPVIINIKFSMHYCFKLLMKIALRRKSVDRYSLVQNYQKFQFEPDLYIVISGKDNQLLRGRVVEKQETQAKLVTGMNF